MPVYMKNYKFCWQNCKKTTFMLQKFAMVKYDVFVAKICKHALCASTVRDIWWSPLARQLLPPCHKPLFVASNASLTLMMTSMSSTINLLRQMGILPILGTCSNCFSPTGAYKYNYF